jgi:hypothetical protein
VLADFQLTPTDAPDECDRQRASTGLIASPRTRSCRRSQRGDRFVLAPASRPIAMLAPIGSLRAGSRSTERATGAGLTG